MKIRHSLLILIACFSMFIFSCGRSDKLEAPKKIEVTGSAEMEIVPDEIFMVFTLKEYLDTSRKKVKLENIKTDFLTLCKKAGIVDSNISIASYTGNESWDYWWYLRRRKEPDFMSSISYSVKVSSPEKLDAVVSEINENAIENFYIAKTSHSNIEKLRKDVKTKALIAAKNKAEYLAESIGEKVGEALLIQEIENENKYYYNNGSNYSNEISQTSMTLGSEESSTPNFQKIKLRYEMKVEFRLK
jgi:uncharacterized protein